MAKQQLRPADRKALAEWEELIHAIKQGSSINPQDSEDKIRLRRESLEQDHEAWYKYYCSNYYTSEPAAFHVANSQRFHASPRLYDVKVWSRELAKTGRSMMDILKAALMGQIRNVLYISNSYDNAERLLAPIKANLEYNQRIIQDYGEQVVLGKWEAGEFTAKCGCAFRALGAGQSPRGTRSENIRPDCIVIDDIDTDEECLNPDRIKKKWKWLEEALMPAMSVSGKYKIIFNGNLIAVDCCIARAIDKAKSIKGIGHYEIVNIRDERGKSSWPAKNSEEDIDQFLSLISFAAGQKEFYNNPISEGEVFHEMIWGDCPPLEELQHCIVYADPAPSNSTNKKSSYKAAFLMGVKRGVFYVYKGYLDHVVNQEFVQWFYHLRDYADDRKQVYYFIENNKLQDPFYQQVFTRLFAEIGEEQGFIPLSPDTRAKPEKFDRIEGNLEPINRAGRLILNIEERNNPHMRRLEEQFLLLSRAMKSPADGPDCIEGGWFKLNTMLATHRTEAYTVGSRTISRKRY